VDAFRKIAREVAAGRLQPDQIDDALVNNNLYTRSLPDPDLLIRTSGEMRISNFLLWQIAYAELHVTETLWPDFGERDEIGRQILPGEAGADGFYYAALLKH